MGKLAMFVFGAFVASTFYWVLIIGSPVVEYGKKAEGIVNECQQKLPRDQYCTIIAVPENDLDNLEG